MEEEAKWSNWNQDKAISDEIFEDLERKDTYTPVLQDRHARVCVNLNHQKIHGSYTPVCGENRTEHAQHTPDTRACVFIWRPMFIFNTRPCVLESQGVYGACVLKTPVTFLSFWVSFPNWGIYLREIEKKQGRRGVRRFLSREQGKGSEKREFIQAFGD